MNDNVAPMPYSLVGKLVLLAVPLFVVFFLATEWAQGWTGFIMGCLLGAALPAASNFARRLYKKDGFTEVRPETKSSTVISIGLLLVAVVLLLIMFPDNPHRNVWLGYFSALALGTLIEFWSGRKVSQ